MVPVFFGHFFFCSQFFCNRVFQPNFGPSNKSLICLLPPLFVLVELRILWDDTFSPVTPVFHLLTVSLTAYGQWQPISLSQ